MITNTSVTVYHKNGLDENHFEKWDRYNYENAWYFGGKGASVNKGYDRADNVVVRLPYEKNANLDITKFSMGDIIVKGTLTTNITSQQDLENYEIYNITSINNNNFGNNPHIHIGGI